jgi:hypothetical protein
VDNCAIDTVTDMDRSATDRNIDACATNTYSYARAHRDADA